MIWEIKNWTMCRCRVRLAGGCVYLSSGMTITPYLYLYKDYALRFWSQTLEVDENISVGINGFFFGSASAEWVQWNQKSEPEKNVFSPDKKEREGKSQAKAPNKCSADSLLKLYLLFASKCSKKVLSILQSFSWRQCLLWAIHFRVISSNLLVIIEKGEYSV